MVGVLLRHIRAGLGCGAAPQHYNGILLYNLHSATCTQLATTTEAQNNKSAVSRKTRSRQTTAGAAACCGRVVVTLHITWGSGGGGDKARVILLQLGGGHRVAWNLEPGGDAVLCSQAGQRHLTVIPT